MNKNIITDLDPKILELLIQLYEEGKTPSASLREIFNKTGPLSPPITAEYYQVAFGVYTMDGLRYLGSWWPTDISEITDETFNAGMTELINKARQDKE